MGKRSLFILRRPPCGGLHNREMLDMLLTFTAFDQPVSVLFMDDGVLQLKSGQRHPLGAPVIGSLLGALAFYEIERVGAEAESLATRGLTPADLVIPVELIARPAIAGLIAAHDLVLTG